MTKTTRTTRATFGILLSGILLVTSLGCGASAASKRIVLFNGRDLSGWKAMNPNNNAWRVAGKVELDPDNPGQFKITDGTGILVNGERGRTSDLVSTVVHGDCIAHIEFMVPEHSNSGVYFQGRYEVQILDSYGKQKVSSHDCGAIYARWIKGREVEGHAPRVNASRPPGRWQSFDVVFKAPRFDADGKKIANAMFVKVVHNGKVVHENVELTGPTRGPIAESEVPVGPLRLQGDHGPVAYRNIWIQPLE